MDELKLEVGKYYIDKRGRIIKIIKKIKIRESPEYQIYPYQSDRNKYAENGECFGWFSKRNLVEEADHEPEVCEMNELKLEVGKSYKAREGKVIKIVKYDETVDDFPFTGDDGEIYMENGHYDEGCVMDLIEELKEKAITKKETADKIKELKKQLADLDNKNAAEALVAGDWIEETGLYFENNKRQFVEIRGSSLPDYEYNKYRYYAPIESKTMTYIRRVKK